MNLLEYILVNLVLLEFVAMAIMAWVWNGLATRGTGKFFGPFAILAATILLALDAQSIGVDVPYWFVVVLWASLAITGMRVVVHMLQRLMFLVQQRD